MGLTRCSYCGRLIDPHRCNAYCQDGIHTDVVYSSRADETIETIQAFLLLDPCCSKKQWHALAVTPTWEVLPCAVVFPTRVNGAHAYPYAYRVTYRYPERENHDSHA